MRIGRRVTIYRTRWRSLPEVRISRMSSGFCGSIAIYWCGIALEYDHLTGAWQRRKSVTQPGGEAELPEREPQPDDELSETLKYLRLYVPALRALRWYMGARQVNEEEASAASAEVLKLFEAAETEMRECHGDHYSRLFIDLKR